MIDTLFSLAEAYLFMQLVELVVSVAEGCRFLLLGLGSSSSTMRTLHAAGGAGGEGSMLCRMLQGKAALLLTWAAAAAAAAAAVGLPVHEAGGAGGEFRLVCCGARAAGGCRG
jgi:hypothetical protein